MITDKNATEVFNGVSPATVTLKSGAGYFASQSYKVKLSLAGYADKIVQVDCTINGWYVANCVIGGLLGWLIIDPITGAMYKLDRETINETLVKSTASVSPSLRIININDIPAEWKEHLVCIK